MTNTPTKRQTIKKYKKEKKQFCVYGHQEYDIKKRKRIHSEYYYIGYSNKLANRLRNHLKYTPGTRGSKKTSLWTDRNGVTLCFFVTGFQNENYALSFETSLQKHRLPKGERSSIPRSIRRLLCVVNKKTWSKKKNIPDAITLPPLTIHWILPELKPKPGSYRLDFPTHVHHVHKDSYKLLDSIISDTTMKRLEKKQAIQNCLDLNE